MQAVMQATVVALAAASGIAPQQPFVSGNATQRCSQTQGDNTFTYNGILNLTGVQYSSVMFIGVWRNAL
jgi:TPP-dependent indolepyruvate ferredoxin oxidoreductase alpha subunit